MLQIHVCKVHLFKVFLVLWESWMSPVFCEVMWFFNQELTFHTPSCLLCRETPLVSLGHHFCALKKLSSLLLDSDYNLTRNTKTFPDLYMNIEIFFFCLAGSLFFLSLPILTFISDSRINRALLPWQQR